MVIDVRERGREGEKHTRRDKHWLVASHGRHSGAELAAWSCALTGNQTRTLEPHQAGPDVLNDLSIEWFLLLKYDRSYLFMKVLKYKYKQCILEIILQLSVWGNLLSDSSPNNGVGGVYSRFRAVLKVSTDHSLTSTWNQDGHGSGSAVKVFAYELPQSE